MRKSVSLAAVVLFFFAASGTSSAQDEGTDRVAIMSTVDLELLDRLTHLATRHSEGNHRFQTRLAAIDAFGKLGKGLQDAVPRLEELLEGENLKDTERPLYFQHVLQAAGLIGWPARTLVPEILEVSSIDFTLEAHVTQAVNDILKAKPANKDPATVVMPPKNDANPTPLTLADINKQLADINKANTDINKSLTDLSKSMTTALGVIDKLSKQLDAQVNPPKPADK